VKLVFQDFALPQGRLAWRGRAVDPRAIRRTALTTVEGDLDDIAPPGQTRVAHELCANVPGHARRHLLQPGIGHFGAFHGRTWRRAIMPFVADAIRASR
jgi:poly(3-hydroxybutyrate) depolymerase